MRRRGNRELAADGAARDLEHTELYVPDESGLGVIRGCVAGNVFDYGGYEVGGVSTIATGGTLNYSVGQTVLVAGVTDTSFNGTFLLSSATGTTLTYAQALGNSTSSGGTVAVYTMGLAGHDVRFNRLQSSSANVAQTGSLELGPSDPIKARDPANSVDGTLLKKRTGAGESLS